MEFSGKFAWERRFTFPVTIVEFQIQLNLENILGFKEIEYENVEH